MPCEHHSYKTQREPLRISVLSPYRVYPPSKHLINDLSRTTGEKPHGCILHLANCAYRPSTRFFFFGELSSGIAYIPCPILSKRYLQRKFSESEAHRRTGASHTRFILSCVIQLMIYYYPYPHTHAQGPHTRKMTNHRKRAASRNQRGRVIQRKKRRKKWSGNDSRGKL